MVPTLGPLDESEMAYLARAMAPKQGVALFALETPSGWHGMGYVGGSLVWKSEELSAQKEPILTLFGTTSGKFVFHRSERSSSDGLNNALDVIKSARTAVYHAAS